MASTWRAGLKKNELSAGDEYSKMSNERHKGVVGLIFSALRICALRQGAEGATTVHNANTLKAFRLGTKLGRLTIVITHSKRLGEI